MKILHSADWHIGKKLCGKDRLLEQGLVLDEIAKIAERENVDVVVVAGDIFDTAVPSAEAEALFYSGAIAIAKGRYFIAVAGNHDDADRLSAPSMLGAAMNIFLVGDYDNSKYQRVNVVGGNGFLKIKTNNETLNLALMPYPQHSKLATTLNKDMSYTEIVESKLFEICGIFKDDELNVIVSHLFMTKGGNEKEADNEKSDERELGTASLLPSKILPKSDYTALGHIHKPFAVSNKNNAHYSGSLMQYSFDELSEKSVIIVELNLDKNNKKTTTVKRVKLESCKNLIKLEADCFEQCKLCLEQNLDKHVHITYTGQSPLYPSEMSELKKIPSFAKLESTFVEKTERKEFKKRSESELFTDFYKELYSSEAPSEMLDMFLKILNEEELV